MLTPRLNRKIIISSVHSGIFPQTLPSRDHIDWLPVDKLSKILAEILSSASRPSVSQERLDEGLPDKIGNTHLTGTKIYHVVNPHLASWQHDLAVDLFTLFPSGTVQPVYFREWLMRLKASAKEAESNGHLDMERNPAIRLIDFYTTLAENEEASRRLLSAASERASQTLRDLGPLKLDWLRNWMVQWDINLE